MLAERRVVARARHLQRQIEAGANLDEQRAAAQQAVRDWIDATRRIIEERRNAQLRLAAVASDREEAYLSGERARHELATLQARHPKLLGDFAVLA